MKVVAILLAASLLLALPAATNAFAQAVEELSPKKIARQEIKDDLRLQKLQLDAWVKFVREFAIPQLVAADRDGDIATKIGVVNTYAVVKQSFVAGPSTFPLSPLIDALGDELVDEPLDLLINLARINAVAVRAFEYCGLQFMFLFLDDPTNSDKAGRLCDIMLVKHD